MECQIVKCKAGCNEIGQTWLNMQAVLQVFSKPPKILPARGLRLNKKEKMSMYSWESDSKECKTDLESRKVKCGANRCKNWAKLTKCANCTSSW